MSKFLSQGARSLSKILPQLSSSIYPFHTCLQLAASNRRYYVLLNFSQGGRSTLGSVRSASFTTRRFHTDSANNNLITQHPEYVSRLNELNESFEEAREFIKDSLESAGTVYFTEDLDDAKELTNKTLQKWKEIEKWLEDHGNVASLEQFRKETTLKMKQLEEELDVATCKGQT